MKNGEKKLNKNKTDFYRGGTIAAISGAFPAAIGIIRISGEQSLPLLNKIFLTKEEILPRKMAYGTVVAGKIRDTAMAVFYKSPASYTGEDMAEIFIHGSAVAARCVMTALIEFGAIEAERGEFSRRAFLNGKLNLSAAEGVLNLINAQTTEEAAAAYSLLGGELKNKIDLLQQMIKSTLAAADAAIDYPEENLEQDTLTQIVGVISDAIEQIDALCNSFKEGNEIKNGVKIAVIGGVNVGKSLLSNVLVGFERSIVSGEAGTTRDAVESSYEYKGRRFILTDTAGLRESDSKIELTGMERSLAAARDCRIILAVAAAGSHLEESAQKLVDGFGEKKTVIAVENKVDILPPSPNPSTLKVSALTGEGIGELKEAVYAAATVGGGGFVLTELRHYNALLSARECLLSALKNAGKITMDCIAADLMSAYDALGQVTGKCGSEGIINEIFSRFCVGK